VVRIWLGSAARHRLPLGALATTQIAAFADQGGGLEVVLYVEAGRAERATRKKGRAIVMSSQMELARIGAESI
jgi:hypothetical protein